MQATKRVMLAPVESQHYSLLYRLLVGTEYGWRYRFRGATPNPDIVVARLWEGVLAQFLVVGRTSGKIHGLVQLYDYNTRGQHCYASCIATPEAQGSGLVIEGLIKLLDHAFRVFSVQKIYLEALDFNLQAFHSVTKYCDEEARLVRHEMHDGLWHDQVTYALYRDTWHQAVLPRAAKLLNELAASDAASPSPG